MISALVLAAAVATGTDTHWFRFVRASDDASKLLVADRSGYSAMLEILPDDGSPFKLLWSKRIGENWWGNGSATFSWDSELIAVSEVGDYSYVSTYVYDAETGTALYELQASVFNDARLRFTRDNKHLLVWGYSKYVKANARTGEIVYVGDFAPTSTVYSEPRESLYEVSLRPHPAYKDVWVFRDEQGNTMAFDERQERPVWLKPEHRDDRWLGRWRLHVGDGYDEVTNGDGISFAISSFADELVERGRLFHYEIRSTGEAISVRSRDKKTLSVYSVYDNKKIATVVAQSQVWSQSYELLSANCAINVSEEPPSWNTKLTFYALDGTGHQLTIECLPHTGDGKLNLIAYTPDGAYVTVGGAGWQLVTRVPGTAKHDPMAVRAALANLLNR